MSRLTVAKTSWLGSAYSGFSGSLSGRWPPSPSARSSRRLPIESFVYAAESCASTVLAETNSAWAISRLVRPSAAMRAARSSAGVSEPGPVSSSRRGRAPVAISSAAPGRPAWSRCIARRRRGPRERRRDGSRSAPDAQCHAKVQQRPRAFQRAGERSRIETASRNRASPAGPDSRLPHTESAIPTMRVAPNADASASSRLAIDRPVRGGRAKPARMRPTGPSWSRCSASGRRCDAGRRRRADPTDPIRAPRQRSARVHELPAWSPHSSPCPGRITGSTMAAASSIRPRSMKIRARNIVPYSSAPRSRPSSRARSENSSASSRSPAWSATSVRTSASWRNIGADPPTLGFGKAPVGRLCGLG